MRGKPRLKVYSWIEIQVRLARGDTRVEEALRAHAVSYEERYFTLMRD